MTHEGRGRVGLQQLAITEGLEEHDLERAREQAWEAVLYWAVEVAMGDREDAWPRAHRKRQLILARRRLRALGGA